MKGPYILATMAFLGLGPSGLACSCFGPQTFCATLDPQPPQFPEPQWWIPSDIIMAVKLSSVQYGADMKVVQAFSGSLQTDQVIRVWGDCGLLCRHYVDGLADGDTVIWALQPTDMSGNGPCGTSFEQQGDYQLSICGVYWLGYANGVVTGPITVEDTEQSLSLEEFASLVEGCLTTGSSDPHRDDPLRVFASGGAPVIELASARPVILEVVDTDGSIRSRKAWDGRRLPLDHLTPGVFIIRVSDGNNRWIRRVVGGM